MRTCTFCFRKKLLPNEGDICKECDMELELSDKAFRASQLKTKRKCRECRECLPPSRYFKCVACLPDAEREAEDSYFDEQDDWDITVYSFEKDDPRKTAKPRCCAWCATSKPATQFYIHSPSRGGIHTVCIPCLKGHRKAIEQAKNKGLALPEPRKVQNVLPEV